MGTLHNLHPEKSVGQSVRSALADIGLHKLPDTQRTLAEHMHQGTLLVDQVGLLLAEIRDESLGDYARTLAEHKVKNAEESLAQIVSDILKTLGHVEKQRASADLPKHLLTRVVEAATTSHPVRA